MKPVDTSPKLEASATPKERRWSRRILLVLCFFTAITAFFGGAVLLLDPSGKLLSLPLDQLRWGLFPSFLIPGILLFGAVGGANLLAGIALKRKWRLSPWLAMFAGSVLLGWLIGELLLYKLTHLIQIVYILIGVLSVLFGLRLSRGPQLKAT